MSTAACTVRALALWHQRGSHARVARRQKVKRQRDQHVGEESNHLVGECIQDQHYQVGVVFQFLDEAVPAGLLASSAERSGPEGGDVQDLSLDYPYMIYNLHGYTTEQVYFL